MWAFLSEHDGLMLGSLVKDMDQEALGSGSGSNQGSDVEDEEPNQNWNHAFNLLIGCSSLY